LWKKNVQAVAAGGEIKKDDWWYFSRVAWHKNILPCHCSIWFWSWRERISVIRRAWSSI